MSGPNPSSLPPMPGSDPGTSATSASRPLHDGERSTSPVSSDAAEGLGFNFILPDPDRPPERVGPYRIIRELGRGGMGMVLMAVRDDDKFHKRVALKLIKKGMDTRSVLRRFELEKQVLGALNHPNIARVFDAGATEDGRPYFVMEFIEGMALDQFCDTHELTVPERLGIFQKICSAVHHAHQNLIVHRDIKPGNILVTAEGEPKLLDFGIAKLLNPDLAGLTMGTEWDRGPMTPEYASPEQVQGQPVSTASDVYSLGVLLYELLTGRRPYGLRTRARDAIVRAIIEQEPPRPSTAVTQDDVLEHEDGTTRTRTAAELAKPRGGQPAKLRKALAGDLDNIVLMAMRKSPRRRYASAQEFAEDIQRHMDGKAVVAAPETWLYLAGKFVKRNRLAVAASVVIAVSVLGGAAGAVRGMVVARRAQAAEATARAEVAASDKQLREWAKDIFAAADAKLKRTSASVAARLVVANSAVEALEALDQKRPGDPEVSRWLADALMRQGALLGGSGSANVGDFDGALRAFDRAREIRERLAEGDPASAEAKRAVAVTLIESARIQSKKIARADRAARIARAIDLLGGPDSQNAESGRLLSSALLQRAELSLQAGETEPAAEDLEKARSIRKRLLDAEPASPTANRDYATVLKRLAEFAAQMGDTERAVTLSRDDVEIRRTLLKQDRDNPTYQRDLAVALGVLAQAEIAAGDLSDARAHLQERVDRSLEAVKAQKDHRTATDYLDALVRFSSFLIERDDIETAVHTVRNSKELLEALNDPTNLDLLEIYAQVQSQLGGAYANLDRPDEALAAFRGADRAYRELLTRGRTSDDLRSGMEYVKQRLAELQRP